MAQPVNVLCTVVRWQAVLYVAPAMMCIWHMPDFWLLVHRNKKPSFLSSPSTRPFKENTFQWRNLSSPLSKLIKQFIFKICLINSRFSHIDCLVSWYLEKNNKKRKISVQHLKPRAPSDWTEAAKWITSVDIVAACVKSRWRRKPLLFQNAFPALFHKKVQTLKQHRTESMRVLDVKDTHNSLTSMLTVPPSEQKQISDSHWKDWLESFTHRSDGAFHSRVSSWMMQRA